MWELGVHTKGDGIKVIKKKAQGDMPWAEETISIP